MPGTDRLFLGLFANALIISSVRHLAFLLQSGEWSVGAVVFGFIATVLSTVILVVLLQAPMWAVLHLARVPDWLGSTIAGAVFCIGYAQLDWALSNHPWREPPATAGQHVYLVTGILVGAFSGYVCWRVARDELG